MNDQNIILYEVKGKISIITLNRPPIHAFNLELMKNLNEKLEEADNDDKTTCVLLKSTGTRIFSAGLDLNVPVDADPDYLDKLVEYFKRNNQKMLLMKKPIIVQVQGSAIGYGILMILASDLRIFADRPIKEMFFRLPEIALKMYPKAGATILPLLTFGLSYTKQILLTADKFGLEELKNLNIPTRVVPLDELETETLKFAKILSRRMFSFPSLIKTSLNIMNNKFIERWFNLEDECGKIAYEKNSQKQLGDIINNIYKRYS
ncbi:MAG: enoyl-CoA hydratase/isomerase family protein [Promethearchaeota archaeon]